jgi:hypothetical protein
VDFWTSPDAPPLGLVKVVIKGSGGLFSGSTRELMALGSGARPVIVKAPKPRAPGETTAEMQEALKEVERARAEDKKMQDAKRPTKK